MGGNPFLSLLTRRSLSRRAQPFFHFVCRFEHHGVARTLRRPRGIGIQVTLCEFYGKFPEIGSQIHALALFKGTFHVAEQVLQNIRHGVLFHLQDTSPFAAPIVPYPHRSCLRPAYSPPLSIVHPLALHDLGRSLSWPPQSAPNPLIPYIGFFIGGISFFSGIHPLLPGTARPPPRGILRVLPSAP